MIYLKWLLSISGNLLGFLTAPIMFPLAYILKDIKVVRNYILWIYYDDEDEFGFDVYWFKPKMSDGFIKAYLWAAIRNPAWNLQAATSLPTGYYSFGKTSGLLQQDGKVLDVDVNTSAVLKYIDFDGTYMDNKGPVLSMKHSIIGKQFIKFYNIKTNQKYWRYSFANKINSGNLWIELQIGYTTRPTFRFKIKNIKHIYKYN